MFWDGPTYQVYYMQIERLTLDLLNKQDPAYLLQVDFDEFLEYLIAELKWEPLEWYEDQMTVAPFSIKVQRRDRYSENTYVVDEQRIRLRIPISHHPQRSEYFKLGPSMTRSSGEPAWKFEDDILVLEVDATQQAVQKGIDNVRFWLGGRNNDIKEGNDRLRERVVEVWRRRHTELEKQQAETEALLQKLNIPLHQDPMAKAKPVEIKPRQLRTVINKPVAKSKPEPTLNREDVIALVNFIEGYVRQFEVTPKAYSKMDEEELRDLLIGMMNTNYPGSTTGETFSKLGKTDITLRINSGHVLICECKFWSGAKAYGESLNQLFGYLTWRHNYGVLIHFCKLKDMSKAVSEAKRAITEHTSFTSGSLHEQSDTHFSSRHMHPQDANKSVEIHHLFIDMSV